MWFLYEICLVILSVFVILTPNTSIVSASHDSTEAPQQLPFCNENAERANQNAGYAKMTIIIL